MRNPYGPYSDRNPKDVTIRPVDGGYIIEWVELRERTLPMWQSGEMSGEGWKRPDRKMRVPQLRQAVREKLPEALKLVENVVKKHRSKRGSGSKDDDPDPGE